MSEIGDVNPKKVDIAGDSDFESGLLWATVSYTWLKVVRVR